MDNLTHTLTGVAISHTGLSRKTRFATLMLVLAANAPDIDVLSGLRGSIAYLKYHRGICHSLLGITVLAFNLWGLVYWLGNRARPKPGLPLNGRWLLLAALLGTGSHLLLDFTNDYGVRPFLPLSGRWYAWDIMPIIDPLLLAALTLGLGVPWLLGLVSEELGARKSYRATGAIFCLGAMGALWGVRDLAHRRALNAMDSRIYAGEAPQRFSAFPVMSPFVWTGVVETESSFFIDRVDVLGFGGPPEIMATFDKPQPSPALAAATQTQGGKVFLDFARFPWAQVNETEEGYFVSLSDLRFYRSPAQTRNFTLEVGLDKNVNPRWEDLYFTAQRRK